MYYQYSLIWYTVFFEVGEKKKSEMSVAALAVSNYCCTPRTWVKEIFDVLFLNHGCLRLQWRTERQKRPYKWGDVAFSDESHFCLQYQDDRIRIWRHGGENHIGPAVSIMMCSIGFESCTYLIMRYRYTFRSAFYLCYFSAYYPSLTSGLAWANVLTKQYSAICCKQC